MRSLCPYGCSFHGANQRQIVLRAQHIPGCLNVIADKLSHHVQIIQIEWSLHQEIYDRICHDWHHPEVD